MDEYEGLLAQVQRDDDINLAMIIEERKNTPKSKYISFSIVLEKAGLSVDDFAEYSSALPVCSHSDICAGLGGVCSVGSVGEDVYFAVLSFYM